VKGSEKAIFIGVGLLALAAVFYLMILAPKRKDASDLQDQITSLKTSISEENQVADFGEQARQHFPVYYGRLVVLGKAVPEEADTASMMVQLNAVAHDTRVSFRGLKLGSDSSGAGTGSSSTPAATTPTSPTGAAAAAGSAGSTGSTGSSTAPTSTSPSSGTTPASSTSTPAAAATAVPATESAVAAQPIGAVVGPGGLPTLPYTLNFKGSFFDVANFIGGVDGLVDLHHASGQVGANGRLMTVDGFSLGLSQNLDKLNADFAVTAYTVPPLQGLTAGASPSGPSPASPVPSQPQTTPTSSTLGR
jgi:hypothetical protein